ncbi:hypothetical protein JB92DRAFT_3156821 [Gautieria morchelliformis]|nr:hypothetical protein JB92DRAFT_3156821 [Gautieria morchelliformis]
MLSRPSLAPTHSPFRNPRGVTLTQTSPTAALHPSPAHLPSIPAPARRARRWLGGEITWGFEELVAMALRARRLAMRVGRRTTPLLNEMKSDPSLYSVHTSELQILVTGMKRRVGNAVLGMHVTWGRGRTCQGHSPPDSPSSSRRLFDLPHGHPHRPMTTPVCPDHVTIGGSAPDPCTILQLDIELSAIPTPTRGCGYADTPAPPPACSRCTSDVVI